MPPTIHVIYPEQWPKESVLTAFWPDTEGAVQRAAATVITLRQRGASVDANFSTRLSTGDFVALAKKTGSAEWSKVFSVLSLAKSSKLTSILAPEDTMAKMQTEGTILHYTGRDAMGEPEGDIEFENSTDENKLFPPFPASTIAKFIEDSSAPDDAAVSFLALDSGVCVVFKGRNSGSHLMEWMTTHSPTWISATRE